jgi:O-antigen/teichoic acid export membrane protein
LIFILVVAVGTAVWDAVFGSWGNAVASAIYLVLLLFELFWWPKRLKQLLTNADRAADLATQILEKQGSERTDL